MSDLRSSTIKNIRVPNLPLEQIGDEVDLGFVFEQVRFSTGMGNGLHTHPMLQYTFVSDGILEYTVWPNKYTVPSGSGFFVNYDRLHGVSAVGNEPAEFISLLVSPEFVTGRARTPLADEFVLPYIDANCADSVILSPTDSDMINILEGLQRIHMACRHQNYGYELTVKSLATLVWLNTITLLRYSNNPNHTHMPSPDQVRMDNIIHYMHLNFRQKLTLDDLAGCASISRGECCRLFKRMMNVSPIEFLNQYRIKQSKCLLRDTQSSILQIAEESGFPSINHFVTMFKRYSGCTPREYRKKAYMDRNDMKQRES